MDLPVGGRKSVGAEQQLYERVRRNRYLSKWSGEPRVGIGKYPLSGSWTQLMRRCLSDVELLARCQAACRRY